MCHCLKGRLKTSRRFQTTFLQQRQTCSFPLYGATVSYSGLNSGLNLNQDKETKPQTVQIVRQGEATPYWFKFNPL
ncbi:transposase [Neisseria flavescens]|nr:transposase [Neisseria flavescens]